jgi:Sigma-54 interaction domain
VKELVSRAIHFTGPRRDRPFVLVDLRSLGSNPDGKRAFWTRKGILHRRGPGDAGAAANSRGPDNFFDEIGEISLELQAKLLRALQQKEFRRLGKYQIRWQRRTCNRRHEQDPGGGSPNRQIPQAPIFSSQRLNHQASAHETAGWRH